MEKLSKFTRTYRKPCNKTDQENHVLLDLNKAEYSIKWDICELTAVYFCNIHSSVYCVEHVISHYSSSAKFNSDTDSFVY